MQTSIFSYSIKYVLISICSVKTYMKISKQLNKLKNLNVEAEKCSTREEAKKIIIKANKAQSKINK